MRALLFLSLFINVFAYTQSRIPVWYHFNGDAWMEESSSKIESNIEDERIVTFVASYPQISDKYPIKEGRVFCSGYQYDKSALWVTMERNLMGKEFWIYQFDKSTQTKKLLIDSKSYSHIDNALTPIGWISESKILMEELRLDEHLRHQGIWVYDIRLKELTQLPISEGYMTTPEISFDKNWLIYGASNKENIDYVHGGMNQVFVFDLVAFKEELLMEDENVYGVRWRDIPNSVDNSSASRNMTLTLPWDAGIRYCVTRDGNVAPTGTTGSSVTCSNLGPHTYIAWDFDTPNNTQERILAAEDGTVTEARFAPGSGGYSPTGYGNYVIITHSNNYRTRYAHLSSVNVSQGQVVNKGCFIGYEGTTGSSSGDHLHLEYEYPGGTGGNLYTPFADCGGCIPHRGYSYLSSNPGGSCSGTPPLPLDCSSATLISCGQLISNQTNAGGSNLVTSYTCDPAKNESGPEKIYKIITTSTGDITATLSNTSYATGDVDVHILSGCGANFCEARGDVTATFTNAPAGIYYIIVDGYAGDTGPFDLLVDCGDLQIPMDCSNAVQVSCGQLLTNQTNANGSTNTVVYSSCDPNADESGPEMIYSITTTDYGDITATLSNTNYANGDVDVHILSSCDASSCEARGDLTATYSNAAPGTYYIVVDGYNGDVGTYDIQIDCNDTATSNPIGFDCNQAQSINCGQIISSATTPIGSVANYASCQLKDNAGGEKIFTFSLSSPKNLVINLQNLGGVDLDLILLSTCDTNACIAYGDNTIMLNNAAPGTYYIVVDGVNGSFGTFDLKLECNSFAQYTIDTYSSPSNGGSVSGGGTYVAGNNVTLVANPQSCWRFVQWLSNGVPVAPPIGTSSIYSFSATQNRNITAQFEPIQYTVSLSSSPSGVATLNGGGVYNCGDTVIVDAVLVDSNYHFVEWRESNNAVSLNSNYSFQLNGPKTLVAHFTSATSIKELDFKVGVYPNPTSNYLNIYSNQRITTIELYDLNGKLIKVVNPNQTKYEFELTHIPEGIYYLKIKNTAGSLVTHKIVKI